MLFGKPLRGLVSRLNLKFQASHRGSHSQFTADVSAMVEPARKLSRERRRLKKGFRKMAYSKFENSRIKNKNITETVQRIHRQCFNHLTTRLPVPTHALRTERVAGMLSPSDSGSDSVTD